MTSQIVETLVVLSVCHLFGLYNPNQVADAFKLPKAGLYQHLGTLSLYHLKCLNLRLECAIAVEFIREAENKNAATQSRRCITVSVDDTNLPRHGGPHRLLFKMVVEKTQYLYQVSERTLTFAQLLGSISSGITSHFLVTS